MAIAGGIVLGLAVGAALASAVTGLQNDGTLLGGGIAGLGLGLMVAATIDE